MSECVSDQGKNQDKIRVSNLSIGAIVLTKKINLCTEQETKCSINPVAELLWLLSRLKFVWD